MGCSVSASELTQIRSDAVAIVCDTTCTVQRETRTSDGMGQATSSWNTVLTCNVGVAEPTAGHLQNYAYLIADLAAWQVKFPYGSDIQAQDHLLITGQETQQTLVVQVLLEPRSYAALLTVIATELKG